MICDKIHDCLENFNKPIDNWKDPKGGKSTFIIRNNKRINYSKIDFGNCVFKERENDTKCDYALVTVDSIFYVELKGSDVQKGYKQLAETIKETVKCFPELSIKARMVVTKNGAPAIAKKSTGYKDLVRLTKNDEIVKQHVLTEIIS